MEFCSDHDRTVDDVQAMDTDDYPPGASHGVELEEDLDDRTDLHQEQQDTGSSNVDDPQLLWRDVPNSRNLHRLSISIAVTPSVSVEVESKFLVSAFLSLSGLVSRPVHLF